MRKAARAIIIINDRVLVMHRNKYGSEYYTLVGGRVNDNETLEDALVREVKEETGLDVASWRLVFTEKHPEPYNEQYIYLCQVEPHESAAIQNGSEEEVMNRYQLNLHKLAWIPTNSFARLPFRTPQLHTAITESLKKGFPPEPQQL